VQDDAQAVGLLPTQSHVPRKPNTSAAARYSNPKPAAHYKQFFLVSLYLSSLTQLASVYSFSRTQLVAARTAHSARVTTSNTWLFGLVLWFSLRVREVLGSIPRTALCRSLSTVQGQRVAFMWWHSGHARSAGCLVLSGGTMYQTSCVFPACYCGDFK